MIEMEPRQDRLPSSQDYAGGARRRAAGLGLLALLLSIAFAVGLVSVGAADAPVMFVLLTIIATFVCVLRFRGAALYVTLTAVCLFELYPSGYSDAITDRLMFFSNINTLFQDYAHAQVKAIPFSLFELIIVTAAVASFVRAVLTNTLRVRGGALLVPVAIYIGFVMLGWLVGLASGGDFKISLQEVRSQVYFFLAYLMAVNVVRDRSQITAILWVMAICIGVKGILYTFRRYVTLAGVPIPDQGVGSHEEAFLFDAFVVLALVLFLCGIYKRLQWLMWCFMPMVVLGNLATNRRAATAAVVVIVPTLIAAAFQGLPKRRKLAAGLGLFLAIVGPLYYQAFKNSSSALAQPARAIKSQFQPDDRDALSNAYRDAESMDLYATIKSSPILGYGYGRKMIHAVPIADISKTYEWWDIMTHNQILWVWMRVGTFGFFAFWMMIAAIIFKACEAIKAQDADLEVKAVGLFTLVVIGMLLIFGLLDLQLSNFRDMLFAGMWVGFLAATPYFKPLPKQEEDESKTPPPISRRELYAKQRGEMPPPRPNAPVGGISIGPLGTPPPAPPPSALATRRAERERGVRIRLPSLTQWGRGRGWGFLMLHPALPGM